MQRTLDTAMYYMVKAYKTKDADRKRQYQDESIRLYNLYRLGSWYVNTYR